MKDLTVKFIRIEEGVLAFSLLAIAVLTFVEAVLRYTISYTFTWFGELANYSMIFCTYLGASIGVKYGTHFSMEALTEYCPDRVSHLLKVAAYSISGAMALVFVYYGTGHLFSLRAHGVKSPAMQLPMYIAYIPIPLFSISLALRFFSVAWRHLQAYRKGEPFERVRKKD